LAIKYLDAKRIRGSSTAEGSTLTPVIDGSDTVLIFTEGGTFTPAGSFNVEYLVVGGGGSGGFWLGGGGGAGAYRANGTKDHGVTAQAYTITFFDTITSEGGGYGASHTSGDGGSSAGSGGGASDNGSAGIGGLYGNNGGVGSNFGDSGDTGGGGGGSSTAGTNGANDSPAGAGGNGTQNDISGSNLYYSGGGGGGSGIDGNNTGGAGGNNIGGDGGGITEEEAGDDGKVNTGSGGGGGAYGNYNVHGDAGFGGSGGSGIVIIRFVTLGNSYTATSGFIDEKKSLGVFDALGASANGTISGAEYSTTSGFPVGDGFITFDGNNDYVSANGAKDAMTTTGTISCWFYFTSLSQNDRYLWEFGDQSTSSKTLGCRQNSSGHINCVCEDGSDEWQLNGDSSSMAANTWYQVVLTHNGKRPRLYFGAKGSAITEHLRFSNDENRSLWISGLSTDNVSLGSYNHNGSRGNYMEGGVDDFAIWNRALTITEIEKLHFNNDSPSGTPQPASTIPIGLRVHFPFDVDGVATNAAVLSSNIPENTIFEETDTGRNWLLQSNAWLSQNVNYGYCQGGSIGNGSAIIDRFPFATDVSATSIGTLTTGLYEQSSASDPVGGYSYLAGGKNESSGRYAYVQRHQNASSVNSTQVGNADGSATRLPSGWHSLTHGYRAGGYSGSAGSNNAIKKYSFGTSADESDIANLSQSRHRGSQSSSATHGYMCGGHDT